MGLRLHRERRSRRRQRSSLPNRNSKTAFRYADSSSCACFRCRSTVVLVSNVAELTVLHAVDYTGICERSAERAQRHIEPDDMGQ